MFISSVRSKMITKILIKAKYLQSGDRNKPNLSIDDKNEAVECKMIFER